MIGMRFKIMDANTTEQVATGYTEEKMEVGATHTAGTEAGLGNRRQVQVMEMAK